MRQDTKRQPHERTNEGDNNNDKDKQTKEMRRKRADNMQNKETHSETQ
jgi:hypothetical protein